MARSGGLGRHLNRVAGEVRSFDSMDCGSSQTPRCRNPFARLFNRDLRVWAKAISNMAFMMKRDVDTFAGPYGTLQLPQQGVEE